MSQVDKDISSVSHARFSGSAVLFIDTKGSWYVGKPEQKFTEYKSVKVNGVGSVNDDSYEYTALLAEPSANGYQIVLRSNLDKSSFIVADFDIDGNYISHRSIGSEELFGFERRNGIDLNENGGLGDAKVVSEAGLVDIVVDGVGNYLVKDGGGESAIFLNGQNVSIYSIAGYAFENVEKKSDGSGYNFFVSDGGGSLFSVETLGTTVKLETLKQLSASDISTAEKSLGVNIGGKPDLPAEAGWTAAIKNISIRTQVENLTANGAKITHDGAIKIVNAAIGASSGEAVGQEIFNDLKAIASRGDAIFSSLDLAGQESGYLSFVFDKMVNGSAANNFFTGGQTKAESLGNLSATSTAAQLQLLSKKWLLGEDLPNPTIEGDTANPAASGGAGTYQKVNAALFVDGADMLDVNQGNAGTCYLLAAIAGVAKTNPRAFEKVFVSNGTNAEGSATWGVRFIGNDGKASWVTVNNQLVMRESGETNAKVKGVDASGKTVAELWVPLLEKAYAQANELKIFGRENASNSMLSIEGGLADAVPHLIGGIATKYAQTEELINGNPLLKTTALTGDLTELAGLIKAVNDNKVIWIGSDAQTKDDMGKVMFTNGHAYMAFDADPLSASNSTVMIYNPWGATSEAHASPFAIDLVGVVGQAGYDFYFSV